MILQNLTRNRGIGSNSYLLEVGNERVLLDAGMSPKEEGTDALPRLDLISSDPLTSIIITHCHLDHIGGLPVAMREHPEAPVYMTETTAALTEAMLHNSVNVMTSKREELGEMDYPFFTHSEIDDLIERWQYRRLEKRFHMPTDDNVKATFYHAGHIAGSAGVHLRNGDQSLFYTGDVQFSDQTVTPAATFPTEPIDTLVMETTRGADDATGYDRDKEKERLGQTIEETFNRGGAVLIPVFATGKTQEVLMMLHELKREGIVPACPVIIGGLSTKMTVISDKFADLTPRRYPGFRILEEVELSVASRRRNKEIQYSPHSVYALSSGMMMEHTLSNRFGMDFIDNPKNSLLFVGYVDPSTPAADILNAQSGDPIQLDAAHPPVELRCQVERFHFSGHATREEMVEYATATQPKNIVLVHGDDDAMEWFKQTLPQHLPKTRIFTPESEERIELSP